MVAIKTIMGQTSTYVTKAFKVLTDKDLLTQAKEAGLQSEFMTMKVYAIIMLLKNVNVIKSESKIFSIVGLILIASIGVLHSSNIYAGAMSEHANLSLQLRKDNLAALGQTFKCSASVKISIYQSIMLATVIVSALAIAFCEIKKFYSSFCYLWRGL